MLNRIGRFGVMGAALLAGLALSACKGDKGGDATASADSAAAANAPAPAGSTAPALSDPQIAQIALVASTGDSANGELAKSKATNPDVKNFAETMVTDHTAMNKQATELAGKLNVTPEETDASRGLKESATQTGASLSSKSGKDFDKGYIDAEVTMHQNVLDALDKQLVPNAQNPELKNLLQQARTAVAAHLERAKQIQAKLGA